MEFRNVKMSSKRGFNFCSLRIDSVTEQLFEAALLKIAALPLMTVWALWVAKLFHKWREPLLLLLAANLLGCNFDRPLTVNFWEIILLSLKTNLMAGWSKRMREGERDEGRQDGRLCVGGEFYLQIFSDLVVWPVLSQYSHTHTRRWILPPDFFWLGGLTCVIAIHSHSYSEVELSKWVARMWRLHKEGGHVGETSSVGARWQYLSALYLYLHFICLVEQRHFDWHMYLKWMILLLVFWAFLSTNKTLHNPPYDWLIS